MQISNIKKIACASHNYNDIDELHNVVNIYGSYTYPNGSSTLLSKLKYLHRATMYKTNEYTTYLNVSMHTLIIKFKVPNELP